MTMSSFLETQSDWLYIAALVWNLIMILYFFMSSCTRDSAIIKTLEHWRDRIPGLNKLLGIAPRPKQAEPTHDRTDLEKLMLFSRNPRAFNYTLEGVQQKPASLFDEIQKRLALQTSEQPTEPVPAEDEPAPQEALSAAQKALEDDELNIIRQIKQIGGSGAVTVGALGNLVLLAVIALSYLARH